MKRILALLLALALPLCATMAFAAPVAQELTKTGTTVTGGGTTTTTIGGGITNDTSLTTSNKSIANLSNLTIDTTGTIGTTDTTGITAFTATTATTVTIGNIGNIVSGNDASFTGTYVTGGNNITTEYPYTDGGIEERIRISQQTMNDSNTHHQGDLGGHFTAKLNETQPIYYTYDWDMDFYSLGLPVGVTSTPSLQSAQGESGFPILSTIPTIPVPPTTQGTAANPYQAPLSGNPQMDLLSLAGGASGIPRTGTYHVRSTIDNALYEATWNANGTAVTVTPYVAP